MKKSINSILVLVCICATVSVLLALTNSITAPIIEKNAQKNANEALLEVYPDGGSFELKDIGKLTLPSTVTEVYTAENGGYVIKLETSGYSSGMVLMCGISADGKVVGSKLISSAETPSIGGTAAEKFIPTVVGKELGDIDSVDTISGATKTTAAYRSAIKDALNAAVILGGGTVDIRTEEEIFNDNLNEALPQGEGKFNKHFFVEVVEGIDAIYVAENGKGAVCIIGEKFIGVDADNNVLTDCTDAEAELVKNAMTIIGDTSTFEIDLQEYEGLPSQLVSAEITATGNYIIEIKGAGYGIVGGDEYHPASGEYIYINVSLTPDGKVIDCVTISQAETDGIGSVCADEKFYGQFVGKTEETYNDIDAISGATMTTDGYKKAISRAFECVRIFEEAMNNEKE